MIISNLFFYGCLFLLMLLIQLVSNINGRLCASYDNVPPPLEWLTAVVITLWPAISGILWVADIKISKGTLKDQ